MKRTLENCKLRKEYGSDLNDGKCFGVGSYNGHGGEDDEPCEQCKECKLNYYYEVEHA
jgi:hypothetical protein